MCMHCHCHNSCGPLLSLDRQLDSQEGGTEEGERDKARRGHPPYNGKVMVKAIKKISRHNHYKEDDLLNMETLVDKHCNSKQLRKAHGRWEMPADLPHTLLPL